MTKSRSLPTRFARAVHDWQECLGAEHVALDAPILDSVSASTYEADHRVIAVLRPADREAVQAAVTVAGRYGVPVYPVSRGCNWGLGSRRPTASGCALLDLGRLDRILGVDPELGTVTLEPGVSFADVERHLESEAPDWRMDGIGSSGRASVVGNAVERGHGMGDYADRFANVCHLEVVLADGEVVESGFGAFEATAVADLSRRGLGPIWDGLFSQSGFGIVTRLTLWLRPKGLDFRSFFFDVEPSRIEGFVDAWRRERLNGSRAQLRLFSPHRAEGFRRATAQGSTVKSASCWLGIGALEAPDADIAAAEMYRLAEVLAPWVTGFDSFDGERVAALEAAGEVDRQWLDFMFHRSPWRGFTSERALRMCYAAKPDGAPAEGSLDPDRDRCGVLWFCPVIPATGRAARRLIEIVEATCAGFGFDANVGFLSIEERTLEVTGALTYDRDQEGQDRWARACHDAILDQCEAAGFPPYRLGVGSMDRMAKMKSSGRRLLRRLEQALDPAGMIAPGRYSVPSPAQGERRLEILCLPATVDRELTDRYYRGYADRLGRFGVNVESCEFWRLLNPSTRLCLLFDGATLLGGVRIDRRSEGFPLPVESALTPSLTRADVELLRSLADLELTGLWIDAPARSGKARLRDPSSLLLGASVAAIEQLGLGPILGFAHEKTLGAVWSLGFEPVGTLGDGGRFVYPDERYVSTLCRWDPAKGAGMPGPRRSWIETLATGGEVPVLGSKGVTARLEIL